MNSDSRHPIASPVHSLEKIGFASKQTFSNQTANLCWFNFEYNIPWMSLRLHCSHCSKNRFSHFQKSLGSHTNSGPICQLREWASTKTLLCIKCIAECAIEYSGFCKYLTIPLNRIERKPHAHLLIVKMLSSLVDSSWNELFIQTD